MKTPQINHVYHCDHFGKTAPAFLKEWPENFFSSVCTDPPYELGFMGAKWDASGVAYSVEIWKDVLRVMKPGAHLLAFGGTRTYHRMVMAIEEAGFEIRDQLQWVYSTGFPKSLNVSMAIDKTYSTETRRSRALRFTAWLRSTGITASKIKELTNSDMASHYLTEKEQPSVATADMLDLLRPLLPAVPEDIEELVRWRTVESENFKRREVVGKKMAVDPKKSRLGVPDRDEEGRPTRGRKEINLTKAHTEAAKAWEGWGTALKPANEPICLARKPISEGTIAENVLKWGTGALNVGATRIGEEEGDEDTRWPTNVILDRYSSGFMDAKESGASRFFYVAKPDGAERNQGMQGDSKRTDGSLAGGGKEDSDPVSARFTVTKANFHPTIKPVDLMGYLIQLVTPPKA